MKTNVSDAAATKKQIQHLAEFCFRAFTFTFDVFHIPEPEDDDEEDYRRVRDGVENLLVQLEGIDNLSVSELDELCRNAKTLAAMVDELAGANGCATRHIWEECQ